MSQPHNLSDRRSHLSPEQQKRLQSRLKGDGTGRGSGGIPAPPQRDLAPVSFAQQRLWFHWQLDATSAAYHLIGGLELTGRVDVEHLRRCIRAIVARHASLRTTFRPDASGTALQVVHGASDIEIPCVDLATPTDADPAG